MPRIPKLNRQIGERIRASRISAGFETASDLARHIGAEPPTVRKWERGESEPRYCDLIEISRATKRSLDFIVAGADDKK